MEDYEDVKPKLWYEEIADAGRTDAEPPEELLIKLKNEAEKGLNADVANYNIRNSKGNSHFRWMKTVMAKGITYDKVAAYVVTIQNNPLYHLDALSNLVGMVKVGKKNEFIIIIDSLIDLFLENLLIPHRKLIPFRLRPLTKLNELSSGNVVTHKKYLSYWFFEDQLKEIYTSFMLSLNTISHDTVEKNKEKAIGALKKLLAGNPEQEQNLLKHLVNKLGDPSKKIASKVIYSLSSLLNQHSNMQGVVLNEIEKVLFRSNVSSRTQYYSLCFLSQFYLNHENKAIAQHLIELYFSFFKACVKKGEVNSRMMSVLLMGVNRAFPYSELKVDKISDHIDTLYRIVHIANFNVSLHALRLLNQVSCSNGKVNDRFLSALYRKLPDPHITNTFHQAMLLSLVYKTLTYDKQVDRVKVIIKRLLQIAAYAQPSMACGVLYVVSQVIRKNNNLVALILPKAPENQDDEDEEEEKYFDVKEENTKDEKVEINAETDEDNRVVRKKNDLVARENEDDEDEKDFDIKEENIDDEKVEFINVETAKDRRLVRKKNNLVARENEDDEDEKDFDIKEENIDDEKVEFINVETAKDRRLVRKKNNLVALENEDNEDEKYIDIKDENIEDEKPEVKAKLGKPTTSWLHKKKTTARLVGYNGLHRNPLHAGGEYCGYTELNVLKNHFHPTVALFATNLLNEQLINYTGDPLKDFSLIRFLDRFVFKNPKRREDHPKEGLQSVLRPRQNYRPKGIRAVPVESSTYLNNMRENIPIEERFLHMYLQKRNKAAPEKDDDDGSDLDSVASEEFEEMLGSMMKIKDDDDDEELDYMESIEEGLKSKKKRGKAKSNEEEEEDEDAGGNDLEGDDLEPDGDDDIFGEDDDDSEILFDSDDEESQSSRKKKKNDTSSLFASAEEFASILEEEGTSKIAPGSSNAWSNKDNAHLRQISWEEKRNQWLKGYNKSMGKNDGNNFKNKKGHKRKQSMGKDDGTNFKNKKAHKRKQNNQHFQKKKKQKT
ncbi:hypothetical protein RI129_010598 [Pyrocoelia pectoralis]|uniref:CCAAT/enhancer-binding protein zeta n=1 Tax=Pyrocoelia pectoralis TaxID=417401 RepID=A0AAN7ZEL5_9COLE